MTTKSNLLTSLSGSLSGLDDSTGGLGTYLQDISKTLSRALSNSQKAAKVSSQSVSDSLLSPFASTTSRAAVTSAMGSLQGLSGYLAPTTSKNISGSGGEGLAKAQPRSVSAADDISPSSILLTGFAQSDGQVSGALSKLISRGQRHL